MNIAALYDLADRENIAIDEFPMKHKVSLSLMDNDGNCYIAIDTLQLDSAQSEKIILAHELGHCMTGSFYNKYAACDIRKRHENHADKWSFSAIVPENEVKEAVSSGFTEVWQLAEHFNVPYDYMEKACHWYKYHNMDVIA